MPAHIKYPVVDGKKECGTCGEWKPISEYKKARKHYVSSCRDCRAIYFAAYRQQPTVKAQMALYAKEYMQDPKHRERANAKMRAYNKTEKYRARRNVNRKTWTAAEKQKMVEYLGGKCVCCGYSKCLAALDFHHKNPEEKNGYGTGALFSHRTFERNIEELDKCVLLCVRCHREIHAGAQTL